MANNVIKPPFTEETAGLKVKAAEDAWNTRNPERLALVYTEDSEWRNRNEFLRGREEIRVFLRRKWAQELDYRLKKTLWCWTEKRIAVTFKYQWQWHDSTGHSCHESVTRFAIFVYDGTSLVDRESDHMLRQLSNLTLLQAANVALEKNLSPCSVRYQWREFCGAERCRAYMRVLAGAG